jgi:hypothetical protein
MARSLTSAGHLSRHNGVQQILGPRHSPRWIARASTPASHPSRHYGVQQIPVQVRFLNDPAVSGPDIFRFSSRLWVPHCFRSTSPLRLLYPPRPNCTYGLGSALRDTSHASPSSTKNISHSAFASHFSGAAAPVCVECYAGAKRSDVACERGREPRLPAGSCEPTTAAPKKMWRQGTGATARRLRGAARGL